MIWEGFSIPDSTASGLNARAENWPAGVSSIAWSEHRPAVFFVLDSAGTLHAFDVLEDDTGPAASEPCPGFTKASCSREQETGERRQHGRRDGNSSGEEKGEVRKLAGQATGVDEPFWGPGERSVSNASLQRRLGLSSETLATGSRPRVAISAGGRVFTRRLSARMFRPQADVRGPADEMRDGADGGRDCRASPAFGVGASGERGRMENWLGTVL